jgi:hypothetical protein
VLNIVDCIWVSRNLSGYPVDNTFRANRLLAGFDPVALDYYAGKHILLPFSGNSYHDPDVEPEYRNCLIQARDRIIANGGIRGEDVTFDETLFNVATADASAPPPAPADTLRVRKVGTDTMLEWDGGSPPFRIWRWLDNDYSTRELLTDCCWDNFYVHPGTIPDGHSYSYRVE